MKLIKCKAIILFFVIVFLYVAFFFKDASFIYFCTLCVWLTGVFFCLANVRKRLLMLFFLLSFFVFLLGGHFVYELFGESINYYYSDEIYMHSNICLLVSLVFLISTFAILQSVNLKKGTRGARHKYNFRNRDYLRPKHVNKINHIRKVSKYFFYITFPFWIYTIMDRISFVMANSYSSSYVDYTSSVPFWISAMAAMTPFFFYLFLATMPTKKECRIPFLLNFVYAVVAVFTGRRTLSMVMILFMVLYFILRHYHNENKEIWIKRWMVFVILLVIPVLISFLYLFNYIRSGLEIENFSLTEMLLGFFQQQGFSSSVIRLEKYFESSLRSDTFYSFFGIVKFLRTNTILKLIFQPEYDFSYVGNSVQLALEGNSLDDALSYKVLWNYLSGAGVGSCYIAELYHDFWYIGIVIGNMLYGIIINAICKVWNNYERYNVWVIALSFAMVEAFLKAPRWNFDIIFTYALDLGMWIAFILVFVVSVKLLDSRGKLSKNYSTIRI